MNEQQTRWQEDGKRAFDWIVDLYSQVDVVRRDARAFFENEGWKLRFKSGWGGDAYTTNFDDWPFVYLTAFCATKSEKGGDEEASGTAAVFGFLLYDSVRAGPQCFAGRVRWSQSKANADHWMLFHAISGNGTRLKAFERTGDGIRTAKPTSEGRSKWPGIEEVTWFEVPLGTVDSPDRLQAIVKAAAALAKDEEGPARELL